ncbi:unnamed protein product [Diatraea saccharalis]|uniref:Uncharacterized protein n=1 Tax=Diatraea saccharalis TaxID=40085 RepID=A0A9N9WI90_9NEOP|nr:unnamed protein product [Diatraea saccharalis]
MPTSMIHKAIIVYVIMINYCHLSLLDVNVGAKKRGPRQICKRAHSTDPAAHRNKTPVNLKRAGLERRCQSLSPSHQTSRRSLDCSSCAPKSTSAPMTGNINQSQAGSAEKSSEKEPKLPQLPQCVVAKMVRSLATKRREFIRMRKSLIQQQNSLLEHYASLRDLETQAGVTNDEALGDVRVLSVTGWAAHDLLLLVRDDLEMSMHCEISGLFGPQVLQQLYAQLNPIPDDVLNMAAEVMARRIDLLNLLRGKHRPDRTNYTTNINTANYKNLEWKTKNSEFDQETERLHRMVAGTVENLKAKVNYSLELARVPWIDREAMVKKIERMQKEIALLQSKLEEMTKKDIDEKKDQDSPHELTAAYKAISEELAKERAGRETLKEVVSAAESTLRVARARIATLERQLKETRAESEAARRKHKDLEQLYRHRETSYDARSKKLLEVSKTGELTIDTLSRQRDALELRVKELREQAEIAEKAAEIREAEQKARADMLQGKVIEQEKSRVIAESRAAELGIRVNELEEQLQALRERSVKLVDVERRRCLEYVPTKENEPTDRENELWKELQATRVALSRAEEELRQSRADKDSFLNSLSRIAQGEGTENLQDKMATELLDREQKIAKLQHSIEEQRENEKIMEQTMTQYENQLAALRLEVKRLRNYDCYAKEIPYQELQTELMEMHMQVKKLSRERNALVTAAASRALMLERHERAAELFAKMTRARRDLSALLDGRTEPPPIEESINAEISRSLTSVCANAADTWTALRVERAQVLRLESAVLAQSLQLEREGRVRTQLERRRAFLEREVSRVHHSCSSEYTSLGRNTSLVLYN